MLDWITQAVNSLGYVGIALLMLLENVFPPLPSELIMPLAGFATLKGELTVWGVILAGSAGSLLGNLPWYVVGRGVGDRRLKAWVRAHGRWLALRVDDIERAKNWFDRYGSLAVFICRLVPGVRTWISLPAGLARMPVTTFVACSMCGTVVWTSALAYAGRWLGADYDRVRLYVGPTAWIVLGVLTLLVAGWVARRGWLRHHR